MLNCKESRSERLWPNLKFLFRDFSGGPGEVLGSVNTDSVQAEFQTGNFPNTNEEFYYLS